MATTSMESLGFRDILVREGTHPPITMTVNGATEVFPGFPVTSQGHTYPDVAKPDATGDSVLGVAGLLENQIIGNTYADDDEIPVYECGSGAKVRMYHALDGGSIVAGEILVAQAVDNSGHVETLRKAMDALVADYTSTLLATTITHIFSIVGRAMETHASSGTVTPIKVLLSI